MDRCSPRPSERCLECACRGLHLFCNLSADALERFDGLGMQFAYPGRVRIFAEGDSPERVFILCSGKVKLSVSSRSGRTLILKVAKPGDVLGMGAAINGSPYEASAETLEPCRVKVLRRMQFLDFLNLSGEASRHAAHSLAREYNDILLDARRLGLSGSAAVKLAELLLEWARTDSCERPELRFTMALTHDELASMAGTSRETVTRLLNQFERDGMIRRSGASLVILEPARLEALAG